MAFIEKRREKDEYCTDDTNNNRRVQKLFLPENVIKQENTRVKPFITGIMKGVAKIVVNGKEINTQKNVSDFDVTFIPYYSWNNRKTCPTILVWMPERSNHLHR